VIYRKIIAPRALLSALLGCALIALCGAHPVSGHLVADYFMVGVPFAKSLDPVTKTNWEGTGVEPDVKVAAADALTRAEKLALEKIQAKKDGK